MIFIWVLIGLFLLSLFWLVATYNGLVVLKTRMKEAWSDIEVQLKRRYNLIPNLVKTVKGYATHEKDVFRQVTEARTKALGAGSPEEVAEAEGQLNKTLKTLFAVAENYPQLKASGNFQKLQEELRDTEDKIQAARRFYNANVRDYNIRCQTFPASIIANMFGFKPAKLFELEGSEAEEARKVPEVDFEDTKDKK
ncbi:LemA family protein [bacterium]|nr:LemA family protein [bacterium]